MAIRRATSQGRSRASGVTSAPILMLVVVRATEVSAIQGYVAANDTAEACTALGAFINEVDAQTGKKISSAQASSLVTQAHNIEAALDC